MMAGLTSPARPWFRLTTPDPAMAEYGPVRMWLDRVEERIRQVLAKSNLYNMLPSLYLCIGVHGTAVGIIDEDPEDVVRGYALPVGSFVLANSERQRVDTVFREVPMTVSSVIRKFGIDKVSKNVREQYARGNYDQVIWVIHAIEPNRERNEQRADYKGMAFKSCWFEKNRSDTEDVFLRESGYKAFPAVAPRWDVIGGDVYGRGPGMDALGDAKALQHLEKRKAQLVDKLVSPPMVGPPELANGRASLLPGDVTYLPAGSGKFEPAVVIQPTGVQIVDEVIREHENRINATFFADLWLMMSQSDRRQITAREIDERHEEKMLQLGPVLERLQDELLDPLIDRVFGILLERQEIPIPPPELQGSDLRVEFISIMAQAQKMLGITSIERFTGFTSTLAQVRPDVLDKVNFDEMVDAYADALGIKTNLVVSDEQVAKVREDRATQAEAQQQMAMAQQAAEGAKTLSETKTQEDNELTRLLGGLGGLVPPVGAA
jgi:hypothetical protein